MSSRQPLSLLFWSVLFLALSPLAVLYFIQLWPIDHYQFFPVLILAVTLLFVGRWDRQLRLPGTYLAWALIGGGLLTSLLAAYYWSPWLGCLSLLLCLGAFFRSQYEAEPVKWGLLHLWPPCWLLLRLPLNGDFQLTGWLQTSTATISSHVLDRMGVMHRLAGNVFSLPKGDLFVEAACSGVQSLFAVLFCALLLVAWNRRSPLLIPIYLVAGMLWAGVMNIARVVTIAIAQEWWAMDLAHGWRHEVLGYLALASSILLLLSTDRGLRVLFYPVPDEIENERANPMCTGWNRTFQQMSGAVANSGLSVPVTNKRWLRALSYATLALMIAVSFVPQVMAAVKHYSEILAPRQIDYWEPKQDLFAGVEGLKVLDYQTFKDSSNPTLGVNAHLWVCDLNGIVSRIVASQHTEVHDLCVCYRANGWRIVDRKKKSADEWDYVDADFVNSDTVYGSLIFSTVDSNGQPVKLNSWNLSDMFRSRTTDRESPDQVSYHGVSVNIQLWTTSETPVTAEQRELLESKHLQLREAIRLSLAKSH